MDDLLPTAVAKGFFGARAFNRAGKSTLYIGNVTSGKITNATAIGELIQ